jgi:hypothetical protein
MSPLHRCLLAIALAGCSGVSPRSTLREKASPNAPADILAGWERVNAVRRAAGLEAVPLDEELCAGAALHARYLDLNKGRPELEGLRAHYEVPGLPGYTEEGARAGQESDLSFGDATPTDAVEVWLATLYHRTPILSRRLRAVGFAAGATRTYVLRFKLDWGEGKDAPVPIPIPASPMRRGSSRALGRRPSPGRRRGAARAGATTCCCAPAIR